MSAMNTEQSGGRSAGNGSRTEDVAGRVAAVRRFNRFYTSTIGALDDGFLRTPYSLGEARVIFELAQREVVETAELRGALAIDAGQLSRTLSRPETRGAPPPPAAPPGRPP